MRPKWPVALFLLAMLGACALALAWWPTPPAEPPRMTGEPEPRLAYRRLGFEDLTGWAADDHGAAWGAFRRSCLRIDAAARARPHNEARPLDAVCRRALDLPEEPSSAAARAFFERHFTPYAVAGRDSGGFLTGYFEPALAGARTPSAEFSVPLYARPNDLVTQGTGLERARLNDRLSAARKTGDGLEPYPTRREIEEGALAGRGLELLYLADRVDAFILHVQGSGLIALEDGSHVRVGYAAKNGHPYTSIGRILVQRGAVTLEDMSLETLTDWLRADPERGRALMWENDSFIFFRELPAEEAEQGPVGAQGASLTPGRSLAVDASHHSLGTPIWVESETLDSHGEPGFRRLMIAQDVGSAIRGSERGDIYWGSGPEAGRVAGLTRHAGRFTVLLPTGAEPDVEGVERDMAKPGAANGSGASGLSPEELRLWRRVAETAEPLKRPRGAVRSSPASGPRPAPAPVRDATAGAADRTPAAAPGPRRAPPLAQIPAREARQIAGGRVGLDARVDLHGLRQQAAHAKLKLFLSDAQARGARTVLVITGKGGGEEADTPFGQTHDRGVLKLAVPRWLAEPEFRRLVVGFTRAHMRHGGAGAFYVRLRRPRRMP